MESKTQNPASAYLNEMENQLDERMANIDTEKAKQKCIEADKAMEMLKTLTAIKLTKNDKNPG